MTKAEIIRGRVRGCLMGLAVGDALGAPYEILTPEEIIHGVSDPDGVTGFIKDGCGCNDEIKRRLKERLIGAITDDTQLSEASALSLIRSCGYNREDQARAFVDAARVSMHGWGGTTKDAALALQEYFDSNGQFGRNPRDDVPPPTKPGRGLGNGVAMKVAPLALYHALTSDDNSEHRLTNDVRSLGLMTHGDPRAWVAARGVAMTIVEPFLYGSLNDYDLSLSTMHVRIVRTLHHIEYGLTEKFNWVDSMAIRLQKAVEAATFAETLRETAGTSCYSLESIPFSIATFMRHPNDFRAAVLEAVNAGGDTDTNAAMVGAMVGANMGEACIPQAWVKTVIATTRMRELADQMFERFWTASH